MLRIDHRQNTQLTEVLLRCCWKGHQITASLCFCTRMSPNLVPSTATMCSNAVQETLKISLSDVRLEHDSVQLGLALVVTGFSASGLVAVCAPAVSSSNDCMLNAKSRSLHRESHRREAGHPPASLLAGATPVLRKPV